MFLFIHSTSNNIAIDNIVRFRLTIIIGAENKEDAFNRYLELCKLGGSKSFLELIKEIDDNLFVEVCENLGPDLINKMQDAINGTNLEAARSAILRFKSEASKLLISRINYYKECLVKLDK